MALIYLWRYKENKRNYPGYHLTADTVGCDLLIHLAEELEKSESAITHEIELSPVNEKILAVPNNTRGNKTVVSFKFWNLVCIPTVKKAHFVYDDLYPTCTLELSPQQAGCIAEGVRDIKNGRGDYCIGGKNDHLLWFWWLT